MACRQGNDRPRSSFAAAAAAVAVFLAAGCDAGKTKVIGTDFPNCALAPTAPPASLGAPAFYGKYVDAGGIPVLSSLAVADAALAGACVIVGNMLSARADVRRTMIEQQMRVVVIGLQDLIPRTGTHVPEWNVMMAAAMMALLPPVAVILVMQRWFVKGLIETAK